MAVERVGSHRGAVGGAREVGGAELVAIAAAIVAARLRRLPVLLDGYVVTASALPLHVTRLGCRSTIAKSGIAVPSPVTEACCRSSANDHSSTWKCGWAKALGAMAAVPLVAMACAGITEVPTFGEWFG